MLHLYSYEILNFLFFFSPLSDYGQTYYLISMYLYKFCSFYSCTLRENGNMVWLHISNTFWDVSCVVRRICMFQLRDECSVKACWSIWSTLELQCSSVDFSSRWSVHQWKWDVELTSCCCFESHHLDLIMSVLHKHSSIWSVLFSQWLYAIAELMTAIT